MSREEIYESPKYDWLQQKEIELGKRQGLDVSIYDSPDIPYETMRQLRKGLEEGINLKNYIHLPAGVIGQVRIATRQKIDISTYVAQGYDAEQLQQIRYAKEHRVDIDPYLRKELRGVALEQVRIGLEEGVNVAVYAKPEYTWQQMREIRRGLELGVDVECYAKWMYDPKCMHEIRRGLEEGLDVSRYAKFMYTGTDMRRIRTQMKAKKEQREQKNQEILSTPQIQPQAEYTDQTYKEVDTWFQIQLSEDEMCATLSYASRPEQLDREQFLAQLKASGITYGINTDVVDAIVADDTDKKRRVCIAEGEKPQRGKDGWYEFFFEKEEDLAIRNTGTDTPDYQLSGKLMVVNKGQKLMQYHAAELGKSGFTVTGKFLMGQKGTELQVIHGYGFTFFKDKKIYAAAMDGKMEYQDHQLIVTPLHVYDEVIKTTKTGIIEAEGSVYVKGNVGSRTQIKATGDILIDGSVETAELESGGNVYIRKGMNASYKGKIKAKGDVYAQFLEAVEVTAEGNIYANYSMDSQLKTSRNIYLTGSKGALVGGSASAEQGMQMRRAGNSVGSKTNVYFGAFEETRRIAIGLDEQIKRTKEEIEMLVKAQSELKKKYDPEIYNGMEISVKIENGLYTKRKELEEFLANKEIMDQKLEKCERAEVLIMDEVYDGVTFEICGTRWSAEDMEGIRVRKVNQNIRYERI